MIVRVTEVARWPDFLLYVTRMIPSDSAVAGSAAAGLVAERWARRNNAGALIPFTGISVGKGLKIEADYNLNVKVSFGSGF